MVKFESISPKNQGYDIMLRCFFDPKPYIIRWIKMTWAKTVFGWMRQILKFSNLNENHIYL